MLKGQNGTGVSGRIQTYAKLGLAVLAVTLVAVPAGAGEIVEVDGVPHVKNPATPGQGIETLELRELWRAGGEDDETFFGIITQVLTDDEGNIYLLDTQLSEVQVYSPDGEFLKTLSRQGEGPGETNLPVDMLFLADGTIGLVQSFPGKVIKIDKEGSPAGVITIGHADPTQGGFVVLFDTQQSGGNMVAVGMLITANQEEATRTDNWVLASFKEDGSEATRYHERTTEWDFQKDLSIVEKDQYFVHFRRWALDKEGRVYAATNRNGYAVKVWNPDGSLNRVIEREYDPWKRNDDDTKRINAFMDATTRNFPGEIDTKIEDTEPDITSVRVADDGSVWVLTSRGTHDQPEGVMSTYDVFDSEGHFIKQVQMACEGDGVKDGMIFSGDDRVIVVTGFIGAALALQGGSSPDLEEGEEPPPMEVICYAVPQLAAK
jgi:hypothetical protein